MPTRHRALAVLVTIIWGANFVVTDVALADTPPLVLTALRFLATAVPLVFLVPRPTAKARYVIGYGLVFGIGKFGVLYIAMAHGAPAGLASLVLQVQALFSVVLAGLVLHERMRPVQIAGVVAGSAGIGLLAAGGGGGDGATIAGIGLTVLAGLSWAVANVLVRASGERRPLSWLAYSALVPPLPLFGLAAIADGPGAVVHAVTHLTGSAIGALAFIVYGSTLLGFGIWNWLVAQHGVARVAPFSLLVPIVGIATAAVFLHEPVTTLTVAASALTLAGLTLVTLRRTTVDRSIKGLSAPNPADHGTNTMIGEEAGGDGEAGAHGEGEGRSDGAVAVGGR